MFSWRWQARDDRYFQRALKRAILVKPQGRLLSLARRLLGSFGAPTSAGGLISSSLIPAC